MIALNAAMAEALTSFRERVDAKIAAGDNKISAILDVLKDDIKACKPVRFDGNGYSEAWVREAAKTWAGCREVVPRHLRALPRRLQRPYV